MFPSYRNNLSDLHDKSTVQGYQIPFTNLPVQEKPPNTIKMSEQQSLVVDQEISQLLEKGAIQKGETAKEEFLSNLFLEGKDGGNSPELNLKKLNQYIHPIQEVQNGRFALTEISSEAK